MLTFFPGSNTCSISFFFLLFFSSSGQEILCTVLLTLEKAAVPPLTPHSGSYVRADFAFPQGVRVLVDARDKLGISWQSCENEKQGMLVMSWEGRAGVSGVEPSEFQLYVMAVNALWTDTGIQEAYTRRAEFQLVSRLTP